MRRAAASADGFAPPTALTTLLLDATGCTGVFELATWAAQAGRHGVAALAPLVVDAAQEADPAARACFEEEVRGLAALVLRAAAALGLPEDAPLLIHGALFQTCPPFVAAFEDALGLRAMHMKVPAHTGCAAAHSLAACEFPQGYPVSVAEERRPGEALTLTERRLADAPHLDSLDAAGIGRLMNREDRTAAQAVAAAMPALAQVVERAAGAIRTGGRIIYMGAGTSGRLGVLDASECPPTFGVDPERVVGLIAGGDRALRESIEAAEDSQEHGRADLEALAPPLNTLDIVVGIAASGTTPYVHGALAFAQERGACAVLLTCNPAAQCPGAAVIALATGPEALPGSTRLKAGTATKMALNIISTGAMALAGYVFEGLMVRVAPVNAKLRKRATRITAELTGLDYAGADALLRNAGDDIPAAVYMHRCKTSAEAARQALGRSAWNLRQALSESGQP
jgi:N-acetylmuramic acid 6-phosphate etherase